MGSTDALRSISSNFRGWAEDHPGRINLVLTLAVLSYAVATKAVPSLVFWGDVIGEADDGRDIALAAAGAGAIVAGFAGVVVVFGLQSSSERFRRLRRDGGAALENNWSSMSSAGFMAVGLGLASAIAYSGVWISVAAWLLLLALLLLIHASIRLIWMLRALVQVVSADDQLADRRDNTRSTSSMPFKRRTGSQ